MALNSIVSGFIKRVVHLYQMFIRTRLETIFEEEDWFDMYLAPVLSRAHTVGSYVSLTWVMFARPCIWNND